MLDLLSNWHRRGLAATAAIAAVLLFAPGFLSAHDIPNDVTVQAFLKPAGDRLQLLVRVSSAPVRCFPMPPRYGSLIS